ncbi:ATP-binding protein [Actinomyces sp.]|uniref:ATP-binding protein n=1 Tax=Actinomyces sp. TaxID=29317 RepID=UPI0026DBAB3D|nr:ATP-binding protein [Actinomyces sp.]MDO4900835.1 ATP-binding protein [Actinomyces sp.]
MPRITSLVIGEESSKQRRRRVAAERARRRDLAAQERADAAAQRKAERALWEGDYLPRLGERRARSGRQLREATAETERATTKVLRTAYPFVADDGLGAQGLVIGRDIMSNRAFSFDPFVLYRRGLITNPNITVAGVIGTGKSSLVKCLALRGVAAGYRAFVPGDVKGEWSGVVEAVGGTVIQVGGASRERVNPLDAGRRPDRDENGHIVDDEGWRRMVRKQRLQLLEALLETLAGSRLDEQDQTALAAALDRAVGRGGEVLLPTVVEELLAPTDGCDLPAGVPDRAEMMRMGRRAGLYLQGMIRGDVAGLFDGPSTRRFDPGSPMVSVSLAGFSDGDKGLPLVMTCAQAWVEAAVRGGDLGRRFMIYDEASRLMASPGLLGRMADEWKLARRWGISNIVVLHRLSDSDAAGPEGSRERALAEGLIADTSTRVVYRQEADQLRRTTERLGLNHVGAAMVPRFQQGTGLWMIGQRYYAVAHYRTPWEAALTDTDDAMGGRDE